MSARFLVCLALVAACACQSDDDDSNTYVDEAFKVWAMDFGDPAEEPDLSRFADQLEQQAAAWDELVRPNPMQVEHENLVAALYEAARVFRERSAQEDADFTDVVELAEGFGETYDVWANALADRYDVRFFSMEGSSMEPTISDGDAMLVELEPGDLMRGDLIYFEFHLNPDRSFASRVIGLPGETVEVRDGAVLINGEPLEEDYILSQPNYTYGPREVPDDHYFVLGDNRRNSFDSHSWELQCLVPGESCDFVPEENIIGILPADAKPDKPAAD